MAGYHEYPLLAPVIALASWTFIMGLWLLSFRLPLVIKYNIRLPPGLTKREIDKLVARERQWPGDNYNHLHEAPTVFYAIALSLSLLRVSDSITTTLAWGYVGFRVLHSLVQATTNIIVYRFSLFLLSQSLLFCMTASAGWRILMA